MVEQFDCALCEKSFTLKSNLKRHILAQHVDKRERVRAADKIYEYSECHLNFANGSHLRRHCKNKHSSKKFEPPSDHFECAVCTYVTSKRDLMVKHIHRTHNEQFHECHICKKKFSRKDYLAEHCSSQHPSSFESSSRRLFNQKKNLLNTMNEIHVSVNSAGNTKTVKAVKCLYCAAVFLTNTGRMFHTKLQHANLYQERLTFKNLDLKRRKLYKCFRCEKTYTTKPARLRHETKCMETYKSSMSANSKFLERIEFNAFCRMEPTNQDTGCGNDHHLNNSTSTGSQIVSNFDDLSVLMVEETWAEDQLDADANTTANMDVASNFPKNART